MRPLRIAALLLLLAATACARRSPATPRIAATRATPSYELRLGRATYQHYCQTCHGETGAGDGFNAFNLDPHPRDLSDPAFQKKKTDVDLADTIQRGGAGVGLSPLMPPWGKTLSSAQIGQTILYLRSLRRH
jgi:mono/diheme cytochrome c family protein